jgi:hypothetical protein
MTTRAASLSAVRSPIGCPLRWTARPSRIIDQADPSFRHTQARSLGLEDRLGSLESGKLADVVVLDGDLFATPPERIPELPVWLTLLGGEPAYRA